MHDVTRNPTSTRSDRLNHTSQSPKRQGISPPPSPMMTGALGAGTAVILALFLPLSCGPSGPGDGDDDTPVTATPGATVTPAANGMTLNYDIGFNTVDGNYGWDADVLWVQGKDLTATFSYYKSPSDPVTVSEEAMTQLKALLDAADFTNLPESSDLDPGEDGYGAKLRTYNDDGTMTTHEVFWTDTSPVATALQPFRDSALALIDTYFSPPEQVPYLYSFIQGCGITGSTKQAMTVNTSTGSLEWMVGSTEGTTTVDERDLAALTALLENIEFWSLEQSYGGDAGADLACSIFLVDVADYTFRTTYYAGPMPPELAALLGDTIYLFNAYATPL